MTNFETNPNAEARGGDNPPLCGSRVSAVKQAVWPAEQGFHLPGATYAEKPASDSGLRTSDFKLRTSPKGFTLVEILVTVALMSFIILGLLMMFSQTQRAFVSSMTQVDVLEAGRDVIDLVANDLVNMTPSEQANVLNFYADTNDLFSIPANQLQALPSSVPGPPRTNYMQKFYFLSKNNLVWSAVGYQVVADDANEAVGTLYRFVTNISVYALPNFSYYMTNSGKANYSLAPNVYNGYELFVTSNKIADGIVHFRIRAFATNGFPIASDRFNNAWFRSSPTNQLASNEMNNATAVLWGSPAYAPYSATQEPMGYKFWNNAMPAEVELEVGILEPQTLRTYQGLAPGTPQIKYLTNHVANVHLFRQRIHLGNVDPSAY